MQILINMDKHEYIEIKKEAEKFRSKDMIVPHLYKVIESGIALPKRHGRLIDADKLKTHFVSTEQGTDLEVYLVPTIINAPTVLEGEGDKQQMLFNQTNFKEDLRDLFCDAVTKIFGAESEFLDFIEYEKYSIKYDCFVSYGGENYIINRETGEYINWYKFYHIGRCINVLTSSTYEDIPKWIEEFLVEFKESEEKDND